ncbi:cytochrome P450 [Lactifluus subvellereus]|nr:cytochrome P450 [Lactifluus subvellereus]
MPVTHFHLFTASLISYAVYVLLRRKRSLPFIGSPHRVPFKYQWLTYEKWGRETGSDIVHAELLGTHLLLEKRSSIYSDRPQLRTLTEFVRRVLDAGKWVFSLFPYGNKWRTWHKSFYAQVQPTMAHQYHPIEVKAARQLLRNLCDTPQDFLKHLRYMTSQVSLSIAYGFDIAPRNDSIIALADAALQGISVAQTKGRIFNLVPLFMHLPWWFPGACFKKDTDMWKRKLDRCRDEPYEAVKRALEEDRAAPCIATSTITELTENSTPEAILMARALPSTVYLAAGLQSFVLAMVLYPGVQRRAQEEIDSVLGHGEIGDEDSLKPCSTNCCGGALQVHSVRTIITPNVTFAMCSQGGRCARHPSSPNRRRWLLYSCRAIMHNPTTYPEPSKFKPERFLDPVTPAPLSDATFRFGRRICPGCFFAGDVLWVAMANMLAAFEFLPAADAKGLPVPPAQEFTSLFASWATVNPFGNDSL